MAFFCRISDPHFGGMYMTVFNTFYYLGYLVSNTVFLKLVNEFTFNICSNNAHNNCSTENLKNVRHIFINLYSKYQSIMFYQNLL